MAHAPQASAVLKRALHARNLLDRRVLDGQRRARFFFAPGKRKRTAISGLRMGEWKAALRARQLSVQHSVGICMVCKTERTATHLCNECGVIVCLRCHPRIGIRHIPDYDSDQVPEDAPTLEEKDETIGEVTEGEKAPMAPEEPPQQKDEVFDDIDINDPTKSFA